MNQKYSTNLQLFCFVSFIVITASLKLRNEKNDQMMNEIQMSKDKKKYTLPNLFLSFNSTQFGESTSYAVLQSCTTDVCSEKFGICDQNYTQLCICKAEYANDKKDLAASPCSYERKRKMIAFLLELLVPVGAGRLYLGHITYGVIKFSVLVVISSLIVCFCCNCRTPSHTQYGMKSETAFYYIYLVGLALGFAVWGVVDLIAIGSGKVIDGNEIEMMDW